MTTIRKNLSIDEEVLADAIAIAEYKGISLSEYVTRALDAANTASAEEGAAELTASYGDHLTRFDGFAAAAMAELSTSRTTPAELGTSRTTDHAA